MRIFVILSRVPYPLEKGDKLRAYHQIVQLAEQNEIVLCALNPAGKMDKQKAFSALQPYCRSINFIDLPLPGKLWNILLAFFKGLPLQVGYFFNASAARRIKKLIDTYKPDHIYCQLVRTAEYAKDGSIPKTIDYQDVFSYGVKRRMETAPFYMKPVLKLEYHRLVKYEQKIFHRFNYKTIISKPDRDLMPLLEKEKEKIHIIPNGVDHDFFSPKDAQKKFDLVFTGNMAYPPNVNAAGFLVHKVMPIVWKERSETTVMIAGATPDRKVTALKSEKVTVTGWLDDIRDAYAGARIFIAPMQIGTGLQNKLLEAMSMKIPSITTPLANDALGAVSGENILVGATAEELAGHILDLLRKNELSEKIAENGYRFVKQAYSWKEATARLDRLMKNEQNA